MKTSYLIPILVSFFLLLPLNLVSQISRPTKQGSGKQTTTRTISKQNRNKPTAKSSNNKQTSVATTGKSVTTPAESERHVTNGESRQLTDRQYDANEKETDEIYKSTQQMPRYPGGEAALMKFIQNNFAYPDEAKKQDIEGIVILQFVVTKEGEIGEVKVVSSIHPALDAEAVRVVKLLPRFTPGRSNGKPVNVWYTIPISFKQNSSVR